MRALTDHEFLTRAELGEHLARARLPAIGSHAGHIAMYAELEGVICSGPRRGKQSTYGLLDRRAPGAPRLTRDEAIETLTRRFLRSHGPATHRDLSWWSGLSAGEAKRGIEMSGARRVDADGLTCWTLGARAAPAVRGDAVHLLPIYDEFLNAYRDRRAEYLGPSLVASKKGGYGTFRHAVVIGGQVAGTWRVTPGRGDVKVILLTPHDEEAYLSSTGKSGADAILPKRAVRAEILSRIRVVTSGFWSTWDGRERRGKKPPSGRWDGKDRRRQRSPGEKSSEPETDAD